MVSNSSRQRLKTLLIVALAAVFLFSSARIHLSYAQTPYYQGKTITIVVGTVAGDLYDLYARAIGMVMGKHIPGNPNIIVQNMVGGGGIRAANYIYNVAPKDGTVFSLIDRGMPTAPLLPQYEALSNLRSRRAAEPAGPVAANANVDSRGELITRWPTTSSTTLRRGFTLISVPTAYRN